MSSIFRRNTPKRPSKPKRLSDSQLRDPAEQARLQRQQQAREEAARSKSGVWGPSHSFDSDDEPQASKAKQTIHDGGWLASFGSTRSPFSASSQQQPLNQSQQTDSTKSMSDSEENQQAGSPGRNTAISASPKATKRTVTPSPSGAQATSRSSPQKSTPRGSPLTLANMWTTAQNAINCNEDTTLKEAPNSSSSPSTSGRKTPAIFEYMEDTICTPCAPRNLEEFFTKDSPLESTNKKSATVGSKQSPNNQQQHNPESGSIASSVETPADRRRQRHRKRQLRVPQTPSIHEEEASNFVPEEVEIVGDKVMYQGPSLDVPPPNVPFAHLTVKQEEAEELQRSISELTMRSSYAGATAKLSDSRRMAYYAVGRHHRNTGRGGNRRCYFTGKLILGGAPFYAGSVQQGLRTLVVFCLPSALGLPKVSDSMSLASQSVGGMSSKRGSVINQLGSTAGGSSIGGSKSILSRKRSARSKLSSVDDSSFYTEEEMDTNWGKDREYLLKVLPSPSQAILDEMATRYPTQFETLPAQVRVPSCWKLYVKFCFFSGLPIAEGELHYKARDEICQQYGEEINLSHEVMEAVNGDSVDIVTLPNMKTFRYLQKHYNQQSQKLPEIVFNRASWERIRPEV